MDIKAVLRTDSSINYNSSQYTLRKIEIESPMFISDKKLDSDTVTSPSRAKLSALNRLNTMIARGNDLTLKLAQSKSNLSRDLGNVSQICKLDIRNPLNSSKRI